MHLNTISALAIFIFNYWLSIPVFVLKKRNRFLSKFQHTFSPSTHSLQMSNRIAWVDAAGVLVIEPKNPTETHSHLRARKCKHTRSHVHKHLLVYAGGQCLTRLCQQPEDREESMVSFDCISNVLSLSWPTAVNSPGSLFRKGLSLILSVHYSFTLSALGERT